MWPLPDSSSAVHFRLALIPIPEYARGIPVSQTLSTKALYQSTFGWFDALSCKTAPEVHPAITRFLHLIYSMQNDKSADVLLLGTTMRSWRSDESLSVRPKLRLGRDSTCRIRTNPTIKFTHSCASFFVSFLV